jgi:hypothetical protein
MIKKINNNGKSIKKIKNDHNNLEKKTICSKGKKQCSLIFN